MKGNARREEEPGRRQQEEEGGGCVNERGARRGNKEEKDTRRTGSRTSRSWRRCECALRGEGAREGRGKDLGMRGARRRGERKEKDVAAGEQQAASVCLFSRWAHVCVCVCI